MIEIIPNWHPIFVHFTVALLSLAVVLFVVSPLAPSPVKEQWQTVSRWSLWFGALAAIVTGLTGLYAYNTVAHDGPSHMAMTDHRNWAVVTIILFLALATWAVIWARKNSKPGMMFVICMVIAGGVLASTAWHGGEAVYRYGLGVMSLPKVTGDGHNHSHGGGGHGDHGSGAAVEETTSHGGSSAHDNADGHAHSGGSASDAGMDMGEMNMEGMDFSGMEEALDGAGKPAHNDDDHAH